MIYKNKMYDIEKTIAIYCFIICTIINAIMSENTWRVVLLK